MAQSFPETAHNRTDKKAFEEGWDRIFGKKETRPENKSYKVVNGEVVEIPPEEAKENVRHPTAGLCGEYGHKTFDKEAFDANFDNIKWHDKDAKNVE